MLACLDRRAEAVSLDQPLGVAAASERAHRGAESLERVEAFDQEHLVLERPDRFLGAAVGLGLIVEGRRAADPEVVDLDLVVLRSRCSI